MTQTSQHCRIVMTLLGAALLCFGGGCAKAVTGPTVLHIASDQYTFAFDTALSTSDDHGFEPTLRDRRQGIIETQPLISPSAFEPWRTGSFTFEQVMENTHSLQRRRVRWEFNSRPLPTEAGQHAEAEDLLDLQSPMIDLTATTGPIELRVTVVVERAYSPGTRPSVWTTSDTTRAIVIDPQTGTAVESSYWTPVARDQNYEAQLLAAVQAALAEEVEIENSATTHPVVAQSDVTAE